MEGVGVSSACDGKVDWIIVKGICDFADGKKGKNKEDNQKIAVESSLSLCLEIFSSQYAFKDLGLQSIGKTKNSNIISTIENVNELLFDLYDSDKEKFYIKREPDRNFAQIISQYCVWVHGMSGYGKTNLILRNLIFNKFEFIQINLSACIGIDIENIFNEILCDLLLKVTGKKENISNSVFKETSEKILSALKNNCSDKQIIIFIEEIPLSNGNDYAKFVHMLFSIIISKMLIKELNNLKFVLSSINNPVDYIQPYHQKIHQQVKFILLENWDESDYNSLINLICSNLTVPIFHPIVNELTKLHQKSPRFAKKYFRNVLACNALTVEQQKKLIKETQRELGLY